MSSIRLTEAPLKEPVLNDAGTLDKVWLQYIGDLQDATAGYWGIAKNVLLTEDAYTTSEEVKPINRLTLTGLGLAIYLKFQTLDTDGEAITFKFNKDDVRPKYTVLDDLISLKEVDSNGNVLSITDIYVKDSQFTVPAQDTENTILISGELYRTGE